MSKTLALLGYQLILVGMLAFLGVEAGSWQELVSADWLCDPCPPHS